MPPERIIDEDEEYESSQDSDFAPDDAPEAASSSSDSEDGDDDKAAKKRQRPVKDASAEAREDEPNDSGDEAIIQKGRKKQKRAKAKGEAADDEGGEGGLIKTRSQRAAEKEERKYAASRGPVTVDIDAIWAEMMAGGFSTARPPENGEDMAVDESEKAVADEKRDSKEDESTMIRIKRAYNFAGRVHTEEKLVPRDSAEAKLYLASQEGDAPPDAPRLTKKAFRSAFEPIIEGATNRTDLNLGLEARRKAANEAQTKKLNTVEKSRMDWAGFVDKEGIKDELELAGKSKDSYASRQDFLARSEALRDNQAQRVRVAGRL
ncbi:bucentaur or craniofacial development domain-containing protein [Trichoderma austrokoningii]